MISWYISATIWPILTIYTSYDLISRKDVPYKGCTDIAPNFGCQMSQQTYVRVWIGSLNTLVKLFQFTLNCCIYIVHWKMYSFSDPPWKSTIWNMKSSLSQGSLTSLQTPLPWQLQPLSWSPAITQHRQLCHCTHWHTLQTPAKLITSYLYALLEARPSSIQGSVASDHFQIMQIWVQS